MLPSCPPTPHISIITEPRRLSALRYSISVSNYKLHLTNPNYKLHIVVLICLLIFVPLPIVGLPPPSCRSSITFDGGLNSPYTMYDDSKQCVEQIVARGGNENSSLSPWNPCSADMLDVKLATHVVFPSMWESFLPFARLNLSVTVFNRSMVNTVFVRLQCVDAPNGDDKYCHGLPVDHLAQYGRTIWPCRGVQTESSTVSFQFDFNCFHFFEHSHYMINVTGYPSGCSSSYHVTISSLDHTFTSIQKLHNRNQTTLRWTPMLIVDMTSSDDGVWLRASPSSSSEQWQSMTLKLYEVQSDDTTVDLNTFELHNEGNESDLGVKWVDAPRGRYYLVGYVPRHDCKLYCEPSSSSCISCPSTRLPFYLERNYYTEATAVLRRTRDVSYYVIPICCAFLVICTLIVFLYVRRVRVAAAKRTRDIALVDRPLVLLLYSDDCEKHSVVARELATVLESYAHVAFDQEDLLTNGSIIPYHWLARSLSTAARIVVLISPSTPILLQGEKQLKPTRPFPDVLQPAFKEITKDLCKPQSRVLFVRVAYSPELPVEFESLGGRCFDLPSALPHLVSAIHSVDVQDAKDISVCSHPTHSSTIDSFNEAVMECERWMREEADEGWLEERMEPIESNTVPSLSSVVDMERIERRGEGGEASVVDNVYSMDGLLPPDESDDDDDIEALRKGTPLHRNGIQTGRPKPQQHVLLPPDSDSDD